MTDVKEYRRRADELERELQDLRAALKVEHQWVPVTESGERWKGRDKDTAKRDMFGWPAGGTYSDGLPYDGITHIEHEQRYVTEWKVVP